MSCRLLVKTLLIAIPLQCCILASGDYPFELNSICASPNGMQTAKLQLPDGSIYQGEVKDGLPHGKGTQTFPDRRKYTGEFVNGQRDGQGIYTWPNEEQHTGTFKNGEANGYGIHTWKSGQSCAGVFSNGILNGSGVYNWPDGRKYEGSFKNGGFHGLATITHKDGKIEYPIYKDNVYQGEYRIISPLNIQFGKSDWIDKQALFIDKYFYSIYTIPGDYLSRVKAQDIYGKRYVIKGLILKKTLYLPDSYYWQLQNESSGEIIWYQDEQYAAALGKTYVSSSANRPFLFQNEIDFPPGYKEVSPAAILTYKANWIGQKIKFKTSNPIGFQVILQDSTSVSADKIVNKSLKVLALYKEDASGYKPRYYWKFIDEESGQMYWFYDEHYASSASYGHISSLDDTRPFYVESEIQAYDQKASEFKSWIGKSIWADLNEDYEFALLKIGHLERLNITDIQVDGQFKEVVFCFQRENGSIVTWKRSISKYLKDDDTPAGMLSRVAYLENPFEKYDWSDETWSLIKEQRVRIGWGKEKCIMSWGIPKDINKTIGAWGVHEQWVYGLSSYLYFENGVLSAIQN